MKFETTEHRKARAWILRILKSDGVGCTIPHLQEMIAMQTPVGLSLGVTLVVHNTLKIMQEIGEVFKLDNGMWVLDSKAVVNLDQPVWKDPGLTTTDSVLMWLEQETVDQPLSTITHHELAAMIDANPDTVRKVIAKFHDHAQYGPMIDRMISKAKKPKPPVKPKLAKVLVIAPEKADITPDFSEVPPLTTYNIDSALLEIRDLIMAKTSTPVPDPEWIKTLTGIDLLLGDLGVSDDHLTRVHLTNTARWLSNIV